MELPGDDVMQHWSSHSSRFSTDIILNMFPMKAGYVHFFPEKVLSSCSSLPSGGKDADALEWISQGCHHIPHQCNFLKKKKATQTLLCKPSRDFAEVSSTPTPMCF